MNTRRHRRQQGAWCSKCKVPIQWAHTRSGSWIPLDASSDPEHGRWVVERGRLTRRLVGVELEHARHTGTLLFTNHLEGCVGDRPVQGTPCPPHLRASLGLKPLEWRDG